MIEFQAVFIIVEFLYSKGNWHQPTQFVLVGYNLSLEPNSGSDWTVDGMQDQPWRIDAMQVCLQIQPTALCNQEQQELTDSDSQYC